MEDIKNRKDIELLINSFYEKAIIDNKIGSFFTEVISLEWEKHIPIMYNFWETTLLGQAKYKGNPIAKHIELSSKKNLTADHFKRWLEIWETTIKDNFDGPKSNEAIKKAKQIGELMQLKIDHAQNNI